MLVLSPIVLALSIYMAVVYGYLYLLFTTITLVFENTYHFSSGSVGLTYLGIGIGSLLGVIIFGIASDKILKYKSAKGEMKPEYRLPPMIPGSFLIPMGCKSSHATIRHRSYMLMKGCSIHLRLDSRKAGPLDRPYHRYQSRRTRPPRHLRRFPPALQIPPNSAHFQSNPQPSFIDAHLNLPRRRLHHLRRLCPRRQHRPSLSRRCCTPTRRTENVRDARSGMGKQLAGVYRAGYVSDPVYIL